LTLFLPHPTRACADASVGGALSHKKATPCLASLSLGNHPLRTLKKCNNWSIADMHSRAAARARLACRGTAKTVALAVTNQSSFSSLMADLKEKFDTKDENSSGVLLHEYLKFTMTENNTQDHCISYAKLVQDLAEQVPAIVPPCPVQHKIFVDSLHERFRILKTLERKTKSADLRALFLDVT
jgi:hypothetical protein